MNVIQQQTKYKPDDFHFFFIYTKLDNQISGYLLLQNENIFPKVNCLNFGLSMQLICQHFM